METGSYKGRRVDLSRHTTTRFNPYLFAGPFRAQLGCGACALALITGTPPETIASGRRSRHYSDGFMLAYLRQRGFRAIRLTLCNISTATASVGSAHVLLLSQLFRKNEGTWVVLHAGTCYHNFTQYSLEPLSFLNKPILSAYVLQHPGWQIDSSGNEVAPLKPKIKSGDFRFRDLRKAGLAG